VKVEHTLRHLLLRHLERLAGAVPRERYLEVTRSLRVEVEGRSSYAVTYRDGGRDQAQKLPFDAFRFYERGDTRGDARTVDDDLTNRNEALARSFAEEVFGVRSDSLPEPAREPLEAYPRAAIAEATVFAVAIAWSAGLDAAAAVALLSLTLAEFAPRGRLICSALLCIVAVTSPASAALLAAAAYGLLQLLDPNSEHRNARAALCLLAAVLAGSQLASASGSTDWGLAAAGGVTVATGVAALRSLYSAHFRALPLALPFYCAGLVPERQLWGAGIGLAILVLGAAFTAAAHRWSPMQRAAKPEQTGDRDGR
jgi:hypothetical protein